MKPRLVVLLVLLAGIGGALGYQSWVNALPPGWQGYVEADYVKLGPTQQGRLTALQVARGDAVAEGQRLFDQDDIDDRAALAQAEADLAEAAARLVNLQAPGRDTEIAQAAFELADAQATLERANRDRDRNENLVRSNATSRQSVDLSEAEARSSAARVDAARAKLRQLRAPIGREAEISAQQAVVDSARARREQAAWRLDQRHVTAPLAGRIAETYARPGETLAAGAPVVSLLAPSNLFVRFFVPEVALSGLHLGTKVAVSCDACPSGLQAGVSFISPSAEYTPPVIYSDASRGKLVWLIEARPAAGSPAATLSPGQPVTIRLAAP